MTPFETPRRRPAYARVLWLALPALAAGVLTGRTVGDGTELVAAETKAVEAKAPAEKSESPPDAKSDGKSDAARQPAQASPAAPASGAVTRVPVGGSGQCLVDPVALEDLQRSRDQLSRRAQELEGREQELVARERALQEELSALQRIRDEITAVENLKQADNEEKVAKFVATVEGMSPKAAAGLMASVEEALAVTAMQRLETTKLAKIMNLLEPEKSSRLSELLTGAARVRSKARASSGAPAAANSAKGGERNHGNVNANASNPEQRVDGRSPASEKR